MIGVLIFASLCEINAQITIGSSIKPKPGALLDLKQDENQGKNSSKGLLLPRVSLTSINQLYPMFKDDLEYNNPATGKKVIEDQLHISLIVYNIN